MRILVNCYACSPYKGSEPGMGWNFVKGLSKYHELFILTESKFKDAILIDILQRIQTKKVINISFLLKRIVIRHCVKYGRHHIIGSTINGKRKH